MGCNFLSARARRRLERIATFAMRVESNGEYWTATWTGEFGQRCRTSLGSKALLTRRGAEAEAERLRQRLLAERVRVEVVESLSPAAAPTWQTARWFGSVTSGYLSGGQLRMAAARGRLRSQLAGGRRYYALEDVTAHWPEMAAKLAAGDPHKREQTRTTANSLEKQAVRTSAS